MKNNFKLILMLALSFSFMFIFAETSYAATTQVIAFGDSYSDNGEAKKISGKITNDINKPEGAYEKPSDKLYWQGRYSNGNTAVEVLAKKMGVPLTNYATGGATTGESNYSDWMDHLGNTGVLGQIDKFENSLNGKQADSEALYFIFASANDYFKFVDYQMPGKVEAVADEAVDNIKMSVRKLSKLGAKNFFVVNSSDLTLVPYENTMNRTNLAKTFTENVNKKLPDALKTLEEVSDVSITIFDLPKVSNEIIHNSKYYGLTDLKHPCQPTYPEVKVAASNPDQYYFWDEWHYSRAVHQIIGEKMYEKLK
ncbi:cholinesterase ChoE [Clostridium sp. CTA-5]